MPKLLLCACVFASALFGDGGIVQLRAEVPPYILTVFQAAADGGGVDLSVFVQDSGTLAPVRDANITFDFGNGRTDRAVLGAGPNKLLYSLMVALPDAEQPYRLNLDRGSGHVSIRGILRPARTATSSLAYIGLVPIGILVFAAHGYLTRRRRSRRRDLNPFGPMFRSIGF